MLAILLSLLAPADVAGPWRAALDLAGGPLEFGLTLEGSGPTLSGRLCNATTCEPFSAVRWAGDSLVLELGDFAASIAVVVRGDSLVGRYHNVGRRGPRTIPLRAARGAWAGVAAAPALLGRWDAWFLSGFEQTLWTDRPSDKDPVPPVKLAIFDFAIFGAARLAGLCGEPFL